MMRPICAHCEQPTGDDGYTKRLNVRDPGHRVCGGCRQIVCRGCADCGEE